VRTRRSSATEAVQHAVAALASGGMVLVDDADREDEGDLVVAPSWSPTGRWPFS
jgi:3,4-dihydroxy-2-butanone 4-phosphate synthase